MKRTATILTLLLCVCIGLAAQDPTGGVKGTVVSRPDRSPVPGAQITVSRNSSVIRTASSDGEGRFLVEELEDGMFDMLISADGHSDLIVNFTVDGGFVKDLVFVAMMPSQAVQDVDDSNFTEFDLSDTGYSDSPTILFSSNDVYNDIVGFGFSAIRYKNRGYDSETQDVLLSGVKLNDAITGYSPFSLWTGLNEAMRSKDSTTGLESGQWQLGGFNGTTNIFGNPSQVRKGLRASVLTNSAMYRLRLMMTYASGQLDNGWSYAFSASARLGGNDWIKGVYYRSFAYYAGAEKAIGDEHAIALFTFATPGQRGAQNASTQEVYDLMGDNMYNSNWGYQNGKVRNSRVRKTFEPVTVLKYTWTPSTSFQSTTTFLWRTGYNGYTALDWYDAADPRPDYYRNLPSYAYMADEDYNRSNEDKAEWLTYAWTERGKDFDNYQHVNWDRLYAVNYASAGGRSKYAQEERHVDQNDLNLAETFKWNASGTFTLNGGVNLRWNRSENYKKMADLLGGQYFLNIDNFAERDFAVSEAKIQNDLDYWLANGSAEKIGRGGKYGYDYLAQIRRANLWLNGNWHFGNFSARLGGSAGSDGFWREGLVRKGLFAGTDDNGKDIIVDGVNLTTRDSDGKVVTSKGKSDVASFFVWSAKGGVEYILGGSHRLYANAGYFNDAPTFAQSFMSPRTRNTMMKGLTTRKTFSADVNWQFSSHGYSARLTGYFTRMKDMSDVMNFYDDSQNSFTNFAMTGIGMRHLGMEFGGKVPLFVNGLSLSGVLAWGEHIYVGTPHMVQTVDNSAATVREADVLYWSEHPVYKVAGYTPEGKAIYDEDIEGHFIVDHYEKHHVPSSPQFAAELALNYNINYWFLELNGQYLDRSYLDMNPLYRTEYACRGSDSNPEIVELMAAQEKFAPCFLLNASVGKSWFVHSRQIGFSLNVSNILNNKSVKTGGYEQTRLISSVSKDRYYRFDSKYFYMSGINYMLNVYFRF